jgi:hypothetical protein
VRRPERFRPQEREHVLDPRRVADELAALLGSLPLRRVDRLRDGAIAGDVGRGRPNGPARPEDAANDWDRDGEPRARAGGDGLRPARLRLEHLTAALAERLAVELALVRLAADDARLDHLPAQRRRRVEVGPDRPDVAVAAPDAQVELEMEDGHALPEERRDHLGAVAREGRR